jgi:hypothetical protein
VNRFYLFVNVNLFSLDEIFVEKYNKNPLGIKPGFSLFKHDP